MKIKEKSCISYLINPNLKFIKVKTFNGEIEYKRNCVEINNEYYIKNKDCVYIYDSWVLKNNPFLVYLYDEKRYALKHVETIVYGFVDVSSNNEPVIDYFLRNKYHTVYINDLRANSVLPCINSEVAFALGCVEDFVNDIWYFKNQIPYELNKILQIRTPDKNFQDCCYNAEDNKSYFLEVVKLYEKYPLELSKNIRKYASFLGDYTWGIEAETSEGNIPVRKRNQLGIIPCKDGSLGEGYRSCEFVTVPYSGAKGLQSTLNFGNELYLKTKVDIKCSLHIHIGNIPKNRSFIVAYYKLIYSVQEELLKMFPYYKTYPQGIKNKNYCKKLPHLGIYNLNAFSKEEYKKYINNCYNNIFRYFSSCDLIFSQEHNTKKLRHPIQHKWNRPNRYSIVNFEHFFFSSKRTIESRLHSGTTNPQKIINWLFINIALLKYAEKNILNLLKGEYVTLDNVFKVFETNEKGKFLSKYLSAYVKERTSYFKTFKEAGDYISPELEEDKTYLFKYENETFLF